ncbi:MAG: hypothetical protein KC561_01980 [Myxococcales bacterium]|nr:hypothetical protein [Myxococcales bacterium]
MKLFCPTCNQYFEEPNERFQQFGGSIPCRVCRTPLLTEPPTDDDDDAAFQVGSVITFGNDNKTTILDISEAAETAEKTTMIDLADFGVGPAAPEKTTLLSAEHIQYYANSNPATGVSGANGAPDTHAPTEMIMGGAQDHSYAGYGGHNQAVTGESGPNPALTPDQYQQRPAYPPPAAVAPPSPSAFHAAPTHIFDADDIQKAASRANSVGAPVHAPVHPPIAAPSQQSAKTLPDMGREKEYKRKVVVGGAAGGKDAKTQVFDAAALAEVRAKLAGGGDDPPAMPMDDSQPVQAPPNQVQIPGPGLPPAGPMLNSAQSVPAPASPSQQRLVVGMGDPNVAQQHTADHESAGGSGKKILLISIILLIVGLGTTAGLMMFGILPNPGFLPNLAGGASGSGPTSEGPETTVTYPTVSALLTDLHEYVQPPLLSAGLTPSGEGVVIGGLSNMAGENSYWIGGQGIGAIEDVTGALAARLDALDDGQDVYVLLDGTTDMATVVETLDQVEASGHHAFLAAASVLGEDQHHGFPFSGGEQSGPHVKLTVRSAQVISPSGGVETFCYLSSVPATQVKTAIEGMALPSPWTVHIDVSPSVGLQELLYLVQEFAGVDAVFELSLAPDQQPAEECPP